jgi:hypothetical protein
LFHFRMSLVAGSNNVPDLTAVGRLTSAIAVHIAGRR